MWILAQSGLEPWSLELVVQIAGQVLEPHRGIPSEHALALIQLLLQSCHIQLSGDRDLNGELLKRSRRGVGKWLMEVLLCGILQSCHI